ncbi:hypothetical protein G3M81_01100 [Bacillus paralicheniformis]|uniref:hypothetical protein n=1 Tax=Bacillus paralicheniformis TaxID=1648923 RepID=UPI0013EF2E56|nr:hypothetical protein [Bacillus paralicheniformis]QII47442.1 hypothetical protein G3M81_01100 [Bacillus paralicheniformis]
MKKFVSIICTLAISLGILSPVVSLAATKKNVDFNFDRRELNGYNTGKFHSLKKGKVVLTSSAHTNHLYNVNYRVKLVENREWWPDRYYGSRSQVAAKEGSRSNRASWEVDVTGEYYLIFNKDVDHVKVKGDGYIRNQ